MKNVIKFTISAALVFAAAAATAQPQRYRYERTETDTTTTYFNRSESFVFKGKEAIREVSSARRKDRWNWDGGHFMGGTVGYAGLVGTGGGQSAAWGKLDTKSITVDLNLIDVVLFSFRNFGIVSGLQIESNNYRFRNPVSIAKDPTTGIVGPDWSYRDAGIELDKSKLTTTYMNIPLLFEFQFNPTRSSSWNTGWVSFGPVIGLRLQSYTKVKLADGTKIKKFDDFNLNNLHYGVMAGAGWACVSVWAKYYFNEMFRKGEGPQMQQFSIGMGITF